MPCARRKAASIEEHSSLPTPAPCTSSLPPAIADSTAAGQEEVAAEQCPPEADAPTTAPASSSDSGDSLVSAPSSTSPACNDECKAEQQVEEAADTTPEEQPEVCMQEAAVVPPCTPPRVEAGSSQRSVSLSMAASRLFAARLEPVIKPAGADMDLPNCFLQMVPSRSGRGLCRVQHSCSSSAPSQRITIYQPVL